MRRRTALAGLAGIACAGPAIAQARPQVRIGTGDVTSLYYAFGSAVARLVGRPGPAPSLDLRVFGTNGSVSNLQGLLDGQFQVALVEADSARRAMDGVGQRWEGTPFTRLRTLLTAMPLALITLVREGDGITDLRQLAGRRVFLGERGSGARNAAEAVLDASGVTVEQLEEIAELNLPAIDLALCSRRIDAAMVVTGHPDLPVRQALGSCPLTVIAPDAATMAEIVRRRPYIRPTVIPGRTYPQIDRPIPTVGVDAILATTSAMPDAVAARIVAGVVSNMDELRRLHLAFVPLTAPAMASGCGSVPFHPGAERWLADAGLPVGRCLTG